ncbi:MAG: AraC family transcriptional regulator, partial [Planctomycetota bacterium]
MRSRCEPGWSVGERWSAGLRDLDLWVVLEGRGWMRAGDERFELVPGVAVLARPGLMYEATQNPDQRLCVDAVHFDLCATGGQRLPATSLPPLRLDVPDITAAEAVTRRIRDRRHARPDTAAWTRDAPAIGLLRGLLLDLADATADHDRAVSGLALHHRRVINHAQARLRDRPADPPSIAELAAEAGYSPDHFARVFRRVTGRSPQAAAIAARLDRARHLLRVTPMTASQIADALGYSDLFFFSRQFKRFHGVSPTEFRRR